MRLCGEPIYVIIYIYIYVVTTLKTHWDAHPDDGYQPFLFSTGGATTLWPYISLSERKFQLPLISI